MTLSSLARRKFPGVVRRLKVATGRLYSDEVNSIVIARCDSCVIAGPFKGLRYIDRANCSALAPKLLGTYEQELHAAVAEIISNQYDDLIDIGAAEGYYAVGLAVKMPKTRVHAFDIDTSACENLKTLAALNQTQEKLTINEECSFDTLQSFAGRKCVVICDIEGAELQLLDPISAPALRQFDILVEIHDGPNSTLICDTLTQRFEGTHNLCFIDYQERTPADAANASWLGHERNRLLAVDEQRTFGIKWGHFRARKLA